MNWPEAIMWIGVAFAIAWVLVTIAKNN